MKNYLNKPDELISMLSDYMVKHPRTINWYATQIDIGWTTLNIFLSKGRKANSGTMMKVINFLTQQGVINEQ